MATVERVDRPSVFLSYASADRARALAIADRLEAAGISVWIDRKSIAGGTSWSAEIVRGIRGCTVFLVACSTAAMASPNVQQEIQVAFESRRPILPLLLEAVELPESVVYALAGRQWLEVRERPASEWLPPVLRALAGLGVGAANPDLTRSRGEVQESLFSVLSAAPRETSSLAPAPNNLPAQLTSFVGRARDLAEVTRLLRSTRLLTLTGAGGSGKTRLALEAVGQLLGAYRDGVWLVELAALTDSAFIAQSILTALGLPVVAGQPTLETVRDYLRERQTLLVLDNCEHLIAASAQVAAFLLRSCPQLTILATSRERLGVAGEVGWPLPSLGLPDLHALPAVEVLREIDSVRLFTERAAAAQPGFTLGEQNAGAVAQICVRLDGIPLAIELAAARLRGLTAAQVASRLSDRFRLLTGGSRSALRRQQTLRATVDWSHDLLSEAERAVFRRLAVFSGGWTLEAAEAVCAEGARAGVLGAREGMEGRSPIPGTQHPAPSLDVLDLLLQLVDKSLVVVDESGPQARYRYLEIIRQYATEKLAEAGETELCQQRHLAWCLALATEAAPFLSGATPGPWLDRLEGEHENLRTALSWAREHDPAAELRLAGRLGWFWFIRGYFQEGQGWLEDALTRTATASPSKDRARGLFHAGQLAVGRYDYAGLRYLEQSVELFQTLGQAQDAAWGLAYLAMGLCLSATARDRNRARVLAEQAIVGFQQASNLAGWSLAHSISLFARIFSADTVPTSGEFIEGLDLAVKSGHQLAIAWALFLSSGLARLDEDFEREIELLERGLTVLANVGDRWLFGVMHMALGDALRLRGDVDRARSHLRAALRHAQWMNDPFIVGMTLSFLGILESQVGWPGRAAVLQAAAIAIDPDFARGMGDVEVRDRDASIATARSALGEAEFDRVWARGLAMTLEQAMAFALAEGDE
jgi:non-specific serine/threonine protein kinase